MMTELAAELPRPTIQDPDADDVEAASKGDLPAAERLYRRHRSRVLNLARMIIGNQRDAEDICQETFIKALSGLKRFRGDASFVTWLCRITVNQSRNQLSRNKTRRKLMVIDRESNTTPISQRPMTELKIALYGAISQLSKGQREVLICHDVLGLKHDEIAYVLDCAVGTSKTQLHRARLRLREILSPQEEGVS